MRSQGEYRGELWDLREYTSSEHTARQLAPVPRNAFRLLEKSMTALLVGFDSAGTAANSGAIVGARRRDDGTLEDVGEPGRSITRRVSASF
jgi:hypothetical protein